MNQSENIQELCTALFQAQAEFETLPKNKQGYGYKYTDFDSVVKHIKPILAKYKLGFMQTVTTMQTGESLSPALTTRLFHSSGQFIEDTILLPSMQMSDKRPNNAQNLGASITYMKRYALCAMLGISCDEDTDATLSQEKSNFDF